MANEKTVLLHENLHHQTDSKVTADALPTAKKAFIEPEISAAVDVLEATTFFQTTESGATN